MTSFLTWSSGQRYSPTEQVGRPCPRQLVLCPNVLPGFDKRHPMGTEVSLQVELGVKALATNRAGKFAVARLRGTPLGVTPGAGVLHVTCAPLLLVDNETVAVQRDLRSKAEPTLITLVSALAGPVLRDVFLEISCGGGNVATLAAMIQGFGVLGRRGGAVRLLAA